MVPLTLIDQTALQCMERQALLLWESAQSGAAEVLTRMETVPCDSLHYFILREEDTRIHLTVFRKDPEKSG